MSVPPRGYLTVNGFRGEPYRIKFNQDYPIAIKTEHLRNGINKLIFQNDASSIAYASYIRKLRFDFSEMEDVKAYIIEKQSTPKAATQKNISPVHEREKDTTPPEILIVSHDTSRGIYQVQNQKKVTIKGRATDENGIVEITVNYEDVVFDAAGNFVTDVYLKLGDNRIDVSAMDLYENVAIKSFTTKRTLSKAAAGVATIPPASGRYYALVIGNNNYQYLRKLETARKDARQVAKTLMTVYGFETRLVLDADREDILDALR